MIMLDTQKERLLSFLRKNGTINPLQSWVDLGIYRLSAQIFVLRGENHNIVTNLVKVKNKYGEECRVAEYKLIEKDSNDSN